MATGGGKGVVCVSGAAGYIGCHVTRELLERGYRVRATVRDASDQEKVEPLWRIAGDRRDALSIMEADLLVDGSFDEAVAELDFAVGELGLKAIVMNTMLRRPAPQVVAEAPHLAQFSTAPESPARSTPGRTSRTRPTSCWGSRRAIAARGRRRRAASTSS